MGDPRIRDHVRARDVVEGARVGLFTVFENCSFAQWGMVPLTRGFLQVAFVDEQASGTVGSFSTRTRNHRVYESTLSMAAVDVKSVHELGNVARNAFRMP